MAHVTSAGKRLQRWLDDDDLTDMYLRKAYDQAYRAFASLERPIFKAELEAESRKKPRRAPADELLGRLAQYGEQYERIRSGADTSTVQNSLTLL